MPDIKSKYDSQYFDEELHNEDIQLHKLSEINQKFIEKHKTMFKDF